MSIDLILITPVLVSTGSNRPIYQWTVTRDGVNRIGLALDVTFASNMANFEQLYPRSNILTILLDAGGVLQMDGGGVAASSDSITSGTSRISFPLVRCSPGNTLFAGASYASSVTTATNMNVWPITVIVSTCPRSNDVSIPTIRV
jgi:hypothetical protein